MPQNKFKRVFVMQNQSLEVVDVQVMTDLEFTEYLVEEYSASPNFSEDQLDNLDAGFAETFRDYTVTAWNL